MSIKPLNSCQHEGCIEVGTVWTIQGYDPEPEFLLCEEHAAEFGFCTYCGNFIGGTEDEFLVGRKGICFDCNRQIDDEFRADTGGDYDDDY